MPKGYAKLTCEDCGGKLILLNGWVPECWLSMDDYASDDTLRRIADALQAMPPGSPIVLDHGIEIKTIGNRLLRTLQCDSCGALYERIIDA